MTAPGAVHVRLSGITHRYGAVTALSGVDFEVRPGQVHALVGENGAGKSTLARVLAGLVHPPEGTVVVNGSPVRFRDRHGSAAAGIGVVHQHLSLVGRLTVAEHMLLGRPGAPRVLDLGEARRQVREVGRLIGLEVSPDARVQDLPLAVRQLVEIATTLAWGASVLVLDEPTAVLGPVETEALLRVVRNLRDEFRLGVVLISHKLRDVLAVADHITVLREGRVVASRPAAGATVEELARAMIGSDLVPLSSRSGRAPGGPVLSLRGVTAERLQDVSLTVGAGEVVGVAGVAGSGQTELMEAVVGLRRLDRGTVEVWGRRVDGDPRAGLEAGVTYIPEDRHRDAVAEDLPLWGNAVAKRATDRSLRRAGLLDSGRVRRFTSAITSRMRVRPADPAVPMTALSGGNQQRFVVGRELWGRPRVVLAAEPTRGLDPQSAVEVRQHLLAAADRGAAVVVSSSDLDELLDLSDRIVVLHSGRLVLDVDRTSADRQQIGLAMAGAHDGAG